jgi:hypothetical protein
LSNHTSIPLWRKLVAKGITNLSLSSLAWLRKTFGAFMQFPYLQMIRIAVARAKALMV